MATAVMTAKVKRTKQAKGMKETGALNMFRTWRGQVYTYYQPGVVDDANAEQVGIRIAKRNKHGEMVPTLTAPRRVHRTNLAAVFGDTHEMAGDGKYIDRNALSADEKVVTGSCNVSPFLDSDGSYAVTIQAMQLLNQNGRGIKFNPDSPVSTIKGDLRQSIVNGHNIDWRGKRDKNGAVITSPWATPEQLWEIALKINPDLEAQLKKQRSNVQGVKEHKTPFEKFIQNLDVMRRAREVFCIATGETDNGGGATPCAMPLEQCGFAIDKAYLTTSLDDSGEEVGEYFYRLAIGRSTPWVLGYREWRGLDTGSDFAYRDDSIRQKSIRQKSKNAA